MELGAKNGFVRPDEITRSYLSERGVAPSDYIVIKPDPDGAYVKTVTVDGRKLVPQIACPHTVDNVKPIDQVEGTKVNQVFIGSCANAKYEDLVEAAKILKGRKIATGVRLLVSPASQEIVSRTVKDGTYSILLDAGALITNPGCSACAGEVGVMADGEVTLSTANRNFQGRMGSYKSEIYLASPAVAAATALRGVITDPREFMG
jgi:3-isopropylmalate/(R)-2-methylmalate dehydratase large subunit